MRRLNKLFSYALFFVKNIKKINLFFLWFCYSLLTKKLSKDAPWIPFEARAYLNSIINKEFRIFEWGSGGSTIFFTSRAGQVISIEHDKEWYRQVKKELDLRGVSNCEYFIIEPESDKITGETGDVFKSSDEKYKDFNFKKYCDAINSYPDNYFDLIFVDGRARNGCIENSLRKIKINGLIVLDNSDRSEYDRGKILLKDFSQIKFYGPGPSTISFWELIIFKKL